MKIEQLKNILLSGIDMNHFTILLLVGEGINVEDIYSSVKFSGMVTIMLKKKLLAIKDGVPIVGEEGKKLLDKIGEMFSDVKIEELEDVPFIGVYDYQALQKRLKEALKELTGSSQYFVQVNRVKYPYMPSASDLKDKIEKFKLLYKMTDMDKIEKCLMNHLKVRNKKMIYYILKEISPTQRISDLSSDYDNIDDVEESVSGQDTFI